MQTPIADIGAISYDFQIGDGGTAADVNEFYMNVYANFGESSLTKFYDCRYNVVPTVGVNGAFTTFTFDPFADYPVTISGSSPQPICPSSPAGMDILSPGSTLRVFALNVGDTSANDQGLDGYIDNVVVETTSATTTFDFEAPDTSGPSISEKNPGDNDVIGGTYKISAKVTDPSGVKEDSVYARFKDNDGDVITYYLEREGSTDIFSKTVNTKEFESRTKTYRRVSYRAVDLLGNSRSSVADNVVVDNNGPAITEKTPAENSIIKGIVNVRVNVNDISGVKDDSVYVRFRDAANKEFTYYLTREGTTSYFSREVDTRVFVPDGTSSGPSRVSFRAIDGLGNPRSSVSDGVTIDNAAPTITVKDNFVGDKDAKVFSNVSFKLFDKNEIDKYAINTQEVDLGNNKFSDANFQNLQSKLVEGNNTFVLFDVAGNSTTYEFIYDATAPEAPQVTAPGARQFIKGSSTLNSWTAANDDNGIKNYEVKYQFEGRPTAFRTVSSTSRTQTFTGSYQGPITISVRAQDTAGNWSEFGSEVTYNYDSITPVTTINAPTGVVNGTFTVNGSASDNIQLNRVYVQLVNRDENKRYGGTTINLIPEGSSAEWSREYNANSDGLPDGTYAAHVSVVDRAGNTSSAGWTDNFVVDSTAPDASIVTPSDNSTVSGTVSIQGIVSDENPMNSFFRIEGPNSYNQTSLFTDGRETHDYSWDTAGLDDGEYTITFETRDLALNKGAGSVTSITVTLDNTAPETTFTTVDSENTSPELSGATTEDTLSLSVEIDDKTYDAAVTGSAWVLAENTISPALTPGSYDVTVKATDATGNQSSQTFANAVTVTQPETTTPTPVGTGGGQTQGVNTGSGTPTTPSVTTPVNQQPQAVGTPTVVLAQNTQSGGIGGDNGSSNTAVLGASDVAQADESAESDVSSQNSQVLQSTTGNDSDSDELSASETDEDGCYELFGICWYWYAIPVIAIIGYGLYRGFRKED